MIRDLFCVIIRPLSLNMGLNNIETVIGAQHSGCQEDGTVGGGGSGFVGE